MKVSFVSSCSHFSNVIIMTSRYDSRMPRAVVSVKSRQLSMPPIEIRIKADIGDN